MFCALRSKAFLNVKMLRGRVFPAHSSMPISSFIFRSEMAAEASLQPLANCHLFGENNGSCSVVPFFRNELSYNPLWKLSSLQISSLYPQLADPLLIPFIISLRDQFSGCINAVLHQLIILLTLIFSSLIMHNVYF